MTTITFKVADQNKIAEIYSMLYKYGAQDITSSESLPNHILSGVQRSLEESDNRDVIPSDVVHKAAKALCTK